MTSPNADKLIELAERVEAAKGPDLALDCEIWETFGLVPEYECRSWCRQDGRTDLTREMYVRAWAPAFTASLDAALTLVPKGWRLTRLSDTTETLAEWQLGPWLAQLTRAEPFGLAGTEHGSTPALALVAASLRARASAMGGGDA